MSETTRIYLTGACEGFDKLRDALAQTPGIEIVGSSEHPGAASGALQGGHLDCVLHATSSSTLPAHEIGTIREHTRVAAAADRIGRGICAARGCTRRRCVGRLAPSRADRERRLRDPEGDARAAPLGNGARKEGRIITVFSPKGGTGKTVIATNLAAALSKAGDRRTLLLDLDLQFGDAAIMLGIEPEKTIFDFVNAPGELDPDKLAGYTTKHKSGLDILPGTASPRGRRARDRGEARPAARGRARNLRRDRRRHLAVLPRPDAGDPRPHRRAAARVLPRRADVEERPARTRGRSRCCRSRRRGFASC